MSDTILWCSSSTSLEPEGVRFGKKRLTKEQYKAATKLRIDFKNWLRKSGRAVDCGGVQQKNFGGIGMSFHDNCCQDFMMKFKVPVEQAFKDYCTTDTCDKIGLEAHAEHALRLYQRYKADCRPNSRDGINKTSVAYARAQRQKWLEFLGAWEVAHGSV